MKVTVLDGGFGTHLKTYVKEAIDGTALWSSSFLSSDPEACIRVHLDFLQAGSELIRTNTYQASVEGFMKYLGLNKDASYELLKTAVQLAQHARDRFMKDQEGAPVPLVVGAIGPYGSSLGDGSEYTGKYAETVTKQQLIDWHRPRVKVLVEAGVDLLCFETIPAQIEAEALLQLLKEFPNQKAWLSFSCKDGHHISNGDNFKSAVQSCWQQGSSQLVAVGVNCINPNFVTPLFTDINKDNTEFIPLVVYPNSGEVYDIKTGWSKGEECRPLQKYVREWLNLGVRFIGVCCRTNPTDITKIKFEVEMWKANSPK